MRPSNLAYGPNAIYNMFWRSKEMITLRRMFGHYRKFNSLMEKMYNLALKPVETPTI
jgi:hypothetical protein